MQTPDKVRVSYVLATRNRADFLEKALANVREFFAEEDELIVVDGGSTDQTADAIARNRDLVTQFVSEPDGGEAHALNKGILRSSGRFIKPLSDDDYFYPEAMRQAIATMEAHPDLDAVLCGGEMHQVDSETGQCRFADWLWLPPELRLGENILNVLHHVYCGLGFILTRRVVARVGLFDPTFRAVDAEYCSRLLLGRANFQYLNLKLYRHVRHLHSGGRLREKCDQDYVQVLLRHRQWAEIMNQEELAPGALGRLLGLNELPCGEAMTHLIWWADRLRRSNSRRYTWILLGLGRLIGRYRQRRFDRRMRAALRMEEQPAAAVPPPIPPEPVWDGTLR